MRNTEPPRSRTTPRSFQNSSYFINEFSSLPEVVIRSRESVGDAGRDYGKEVAAYYEKEAAESFAYGLPFSPNGSQATEPSVAQCSSESSASKTRQRGTRLKWIFVVIIVLALIGTGLGVGLEYGRRQEK